MFDSLAIENPNSERRRWTTAASFTLQAAILSVLVVMPIVFTEGIPVLRFGEQITAPIALGPAPQEETTTRQSTAQPTSNFEDGRLITPPRIPNRIQPVDDVQPVASGSYGGPVIPGAIPGTGSESSAMRSLLSHLGPGPTVVHHEANTRGPLPISNLDPGMLISRVQPVYPRAALLTRTQGTVVLNAVIDKSGRVANLRVVSGSPLLVNAAVEAVQRWRYKPYILNGTPIEVETQISVIFSLN